MNEHEFDAYVLGEMAKTIRPVKLKYANALSDDCDNEMQRIFTGMGIQSDLERIFMAGMKLGTSMAVKAGSGEINFERTDSIDTE